MPEEPEDPKRLSKQGQVLLVEELLVADRLAVTEKDEVNVIELAATGGLMAAGILGTGGGAGAAEVLVMGGGLGTAEVLVTGGELGTAEVLVTGGGPGTGEVVAMGGGIFTAQELEAAKEVVAAEVLAMVGRLLSAENLRELVATEELAIVREPMVVGRLAMIKELMAAEELMLGTTTAGGVAPVELVEHVVVDEIVTASVFNIAGTPGMNKELVVTKTTVAPLIPVPAEEDAMLDMSIELDGRLEYENKL